MVQIQPNETITIKHFPEPVIDANNKRIRQNSSDSTVDALVERDVRVEGEQLSDVLTSSKGVYGVYSDKKLNVIENDQIVLSDSTNLVVRKVTQQGWDAFYLTKMYCEEVV